MRIPVILITIIIALAGHSPVFGFEKPAWMGLPQTYICETTDQPPLIDGLLNETIWQNTTWTEDFVDILGQSAPAPKMKTACAMRWDDSFFYIAARLVEPQTLGTVNRNDTTINKNNHFEVFIDPDGDNHLYYKLEINALNTVQSLLFDKPYRDGGLEGKPLAIQGLKTAVHVYGTLNDSRDEDRGWSVEIAIPWSTLSPFAGRPAPPEMSHIWRVNFSADTGVWSPQGIDSMHYPERWAEVLFVDSQYDGNAASTLNTNREHDSINSAQALMDVYYAQRQWFEDHGVFAQTIAEIEIEKGKLMKPWLTQVETVDGEIFVLPYRWTLKMKAEDQHFLATLCSPRGIMTVTESGQLKRDPLNSPEECSCLKTDP